MRFFQIVLLSIPLILIAACGGQKAEEPYSERETNVGGNQGTFSQSLHQSNLDRWTKQALTDYRFTFSGVENDVQVEYRVYIESGFIKDIVRLTPLEQVPWSIGIHRIEEVFDLVVSLAENDSSNLLVQYDEEYGYPTVIAGAANAFDGLERGFEFNITEFYLEESALDAWIERYSRWNALQLNQYQYRLEKKCSGCEHNGMFDAAFFGGNPANGSSVSPLDEYGNPTAPIDSDEAFYMTDLFELGRNLLSDPELAVDVEFMEPFPIPRTLYAESIQRGDPKVAFALSEFDAPGSDKIEKLSELAKGMAKWSSLGVSSYSYRVVHSYWYNGPADDVYYVDVRNGESTVTLEAHPSGADYLRVEEYVGNILTLQKYAGSVIEQGGGVTVEEQYGFPRYFTFYENPEVTGDESFMSLGEFNVLE